MLKDSLTLAIAERYRLMLSEDWGDYGESYFNNGNTDTSEIQRLMNYAYKEHTDGWDGGTEGFFGVLSYIEKVAVATGNLNYQVHNGGWMQWWDNGYGPTHLDFLGDLCLEIKDIAAKGNAKIPHDGKFCEEMAAILERIADARRDYEEEYDEWEHECQNYEYFSMEEYEEDYPEPDPDDFESEEEYSYAYQDWEHEAHQKVREDGYPEEPNEYEFYSPYDKRYYRIAGGWMTEIEAYIKLYIKAHGDAEKISYDKF